MLLQSFKKYEKPELHTNQAQKLTQNGERKKSTHTRGEKEEMERERRQRQTKQNIYINNGLKLTCKQKP